MAKAFCVRCKEAIVKATNLVVPYATKKNGDILLMHTRCMTLPELYLIRHYFQETSPHYQPIITRLTYMKKQEADKKKKREELGAKEVLRKPEIRKDEPTEGTRFSLLEVD